MIESSLPPLLRRAVLATAVVVALLVSPSSHTPEAIGEAYAATPSEPSAGAPANPAGAAPPAPPSTPAPGARKDRGVRATIDLDLDEDPAKSDAKPEGGAKDDSGVTHGVVIEKGGKRVRVVGLGNDKEYDSVAQFAKSEPEMAGMVVAIVAIVFLSPVALVALVVAYRIKKARLNNEAMLRLAERGVVAPAEAMQAIASGSPLPPDVHAQSGAVPLPEQAKRLGQRAAASDLRKGVILAAIGLGFTVASDSAPSFIGLVLLFLGLGYITLWYLETRQLGRAGAPTPPGSAGPQS